MTSLANAYHDYTPCTDQSLSFDEVQRYFRARAMSDTLYVRIMDRMQEVERTNNENSFERTLLQYQSFKFVFDEDTPTVLKLNYYNVPHARTLPEDVAPYATTTFTLFKYRVLGIATA